MTSKPAFLLDDSPIDEAAIRLDRLARVRAELVARDLPGIVIFDPVNLRYATSSRNMQVWTMHNVCRYAFVPAEGPVVFFELPSSAHLAAALETVDEVRPSLAFDYMMVGPRGAEMARREWYREGRVPLHTLRANIDYGFTQAKTTYGIIGVKVWIFKGEVLPGEEKKRKEQLGV